MSTMTGFLKSSIIKIVFSPFHLLGEISLKLIYLPRALLLKILLFNVLFSLGCTILHFILHFILQTYSLFYGEIPGIILIGSTLLSFLLFAIVQTTPFELYDELENMFPTEESKSAKSASVIYKAMNSGPDLQDVILNESSTRVDEDNKQENVNFAESAASESVSEISELTETNTTANVSDPALMNGGERQVSSIANTATSPMDALEQMIQDELLNTTTTEVCDGAKSEQTIHKMEKSNVESSDSFLLSQFRGTLMNLKFTQNQNYTKEEIADISEKVENSTDPSKYIDEELLNSFSKNKIIEDLDLIKNLNLSLIPQNLTILA